MFPASHPLAARALRFSIIAVSAALFVSQQTSHATPVPAPAPALPGWLSSAIPTKGSDLADEIKCYSLPYGAIGFASHVLTYWTLGWLFALRSPWWPWRKLKHGVFDLMLAVLQILITITVSVFTIVRCRQRWEFICIAVWKAFMSLTVGCWAIHATTIVRSIKYAEPLRFHTTSTAPTTKKRKVSPNWLWMYGAAAIVGFVGLASLVKQTWDNHRVKLITEVFGGVAGGFVGIIILIGLIGMCTDDEDNVGVVGGLLIAVGGAAGLGAAAIVVLCAFYSDWILGVIANNLIGVPSGDCSELYWVCYSLTSRIVTVLTIITKGVLRGEALPHILYLS
jgi:hypothetical protein